MPLYVEEIRHRIRVEPKNFIEIIIFNFSDCYLYIFGIKLLVNQPSWWLHGKEATLEATLKQNVTIKIWTFLIAVFGCDYLLYPLTTYNFFKPNLSITRST